jgi:hypothetical protein
LIAGEAMQQCVPRARFSGFIVAYMLREAGVNGVFVQLTDEALALASYGEA